MADSTVAALTAASALTGTELFYGVQSANDVKVTASQIATFTGGGGGGMAIGGSITSATLGSVLFAGTAGVLAQNNTQFFWDNTNHSLNLSGTPAVFKVPNASGDNWFESGGGNFAVTGYNNFGTGPGALLSVTTGHDNVGLGSNALHDMTSGQGNFAVGTQALAQNLVGTNNTGIGIQALLHMGSSGTPGSDNNVALGLQAGRDFQGSNSLFIGTQAGLSLATGTSDIFVGRQAGSSTLTGSNNVAIGTNAYDYATSGDYNTMLGATTGTLFDSGNYNTFIGRWPAPSGASISRVITLSDGTAPNLNLDYNFTKAQVWSFNYDQYWGNPVGLHVYNSQDPGASPANYERGVFDWNIASNVLTIGTQHGGTGVARPVNIIGSALTFNGSPIGGGGGMAIGSPVTSGTSGSILYVDSSTNLAQNNANFSWDDTNKRLKLGSSGTQAALYVNTNPAIFEIPNASGANWFEDNAGNFTVTGYLNFGTGDGCLGSLTTGIRNTGYGNGALGQCTTGFDNFGIGYQAQTSLTSGDSNVAVGTFSHQLGQTISNNVALGWGASRQLGAAGGSPIGNIAIGSSALLHQQTSNANVAIGYVAATSMLSGSDNVVIGNNVLSGATGDNAFNTLLGGRTFSNVTNATECTVLGVWPGPSAALSNIIAITDGSLSTGPLLDYNYTTAGYWTAAANFALAAGFGFKAVSKAGAPASGDLPSGTFMVIDDTSANQTWLVFNKAGTIRKVQLT